jgi:cytochrome c-type biogenesis protein
MLASSEGGALTGTMLLLAYSMGLGIPFVVSAVLIDKFRGAIRFVKRHYRVINIICGVFLILVGVLMACGLLTALLSVFS